MYKREYKIIDNKKWEYKVDKASVCQLEKTDMNDIVGGDDGWELFDIKAIDSDNTKFLLFSKRPYIEKTELFN